MMAKFRLEKSTVTYHMLGNVSRGARQGGGQCKHMRWPQHGDFCVRVED